MAKKSVRVDEIVEILKDDRVIESHLALLTTRLTPIIEGIFNRFVDEFASRLESLVERSSKDLILKHCESQEQRLGAIEEENESLKKRLDLAEAEARLSNLVIHGLGESVTSMEFVTSRNESAQSARKENHEAASAVMTLCNERLGLAVSEDDISQAFRIPRRGKDRFRPIIVKFTSYRVKNLVYRARLKLKKSDLGGEATMIFINEHLTKQNAQIYAGARSLVTRKKATSAWTSDGKVYIRLTEEQGGRATKIASLKDLSKHATHDEETSALLH